MAALTIHEVVGASKTNGTMLVGGLHLSGNRGGYGCVYWLHIGVVATTLTDALACVESTL